MKLEQITEALNETKKAFAPMKEYIDEANSLKAKLKKLESKKNGIPNLSIDREIAQTKHELDYITSQIPTVANSIGNEVRSKFRMADVRSYIRAGFSQEEDLSTKKTEITDLISELRNKMIEYNSEVNRIYDKRHSEANATGYREVANTLTSNGYFSLNIIDYLGDPKEAFIRPHLVDPAKTKEIL